MLQQCTIPYDLPHLQLQLKQQLVSACRDSLPSSSNLLLHHNLHIHFWYFSLLYQPLSEKLSQEPQKECNYREEASSNTAFCSLEDFHHHKFRIARNYAT